MYIIIDEQDRIGAIIQEARKLSNKCMTYRMGLANAIFFKLSSPDGAYLIITHTASRVAGTPTEFATVYRAEITSSRSVMKIVTKRESMGEREISDEDLDKLLGQLSPVELKCLADIRA